MILTQLLQISIFIYYICSYLNETNNYEARGKDSNYRFN